MHKFSIDSFTVSCNSVLCNLLCMLLIMQWREFMDKTLMLTSYTVLFSSNGEFSGVKTDFIFCVM